MKKEQQVTLTEQIRSQIANDILNGKYAPGDRLPSERDFAVNSGASRVTIRRAYEQLEAAGIIERNRTYGTRVAEHSHSHAGELTGIGLITTLPHDFSGRFVEAVCRNANALDVLVTLGIPEPDTGSRQLQLALRMATGGVKDLIIWGADRNFDFAVFERLRILGVNLVFYDQVLPGAFADYVGLDNAAAVRALVRQALADGAKEFCFLTDLELDVDTNRERENTFAELMAHHRLPHRVIRVPLQSTPGGYRRLAQELLEHVGQGGSAILGVNAPVLQRLFHLPVTGARFYCVDSPAMIANLEATGYAQPIDAMAAAAVQSLRDQRRKGAAHKIREQRFTGELILP